MNDLDEKGIDRRIRSWAMRLANRPDTAARVKRGIAAAVVLAGGALALAFYAGRWTV